jgi:2-polyprenyl-6-methoxyphenol hydroxylase-like FAD-dependent oxidoreductase
MPQWDFLNFLTAQAKRFPSFSLYMQHQATDVIFEGDRIAGVRVKTVEGEREVRADLTIAADGRHSIMHDRVGLELRDFRAPIDVLWMAISKRPNDPPQSLGFFGHGKLLVLLDRGDYLQAGFVIPKGGLDEIRQRGLNGLHHDMLELAPFLADRIHELNDWSKIKLLTVQINRLRRWYRDGLLCIGDCAHAMSPAGGVGINLALQDAVATANLLAAKLKAGRVSVGDLEQVQRRREFPAAFIQRMQVFVHRHVVTGRSSGSGKGNLPFVMRCLQWFPILRAIPARLIGVGVRPEHIRSPAEE